MKMQGLFLPQIGTDEMPIRPLNTERNNEFIALVTKFIGQDYDEIDETFAQNILESHLRGTDPFDFFTRRKVIWSLEKDNSLVGFTVATTKRGGSVKLGPLIIAPRYWKRSYGTYLWRSVGRYYGDLNARKLYATWPSYRSDFADFVSYLGWGVELHLEEQYRANQDETVGSFFLANPPAKLTGQHIWVGNGANNFDPRPFKNSDHDNFQRLVLNEMLPFYDDIDSSFVESVISANRRFDGTFKGKGKKIFVIEKDGQLGGSCICTPKRGGAVKISPFLIDPGLGSSEMAQRLLAETEYFFHDLGFRKLYGMIPSMWKELSEVFLKSGFKKEGTLKEPYKAGVNNVFFGKILKSRR